MTIKITKTDKSTGDPYIGQRVGDSYTITKWLGAGGMGSVYVAESSKIGGQLAAVKVLTTKSDDAIARFHAEAFAAGRVNDKFSIVGILDCGQLATGQHYILLEYCDGGSLDALLAERGGVPLSFDHILSIMAPVCAALIAAHAANLVHRDIKPANILFVKDGKLLRARLGDFGIVKLRDHTRLLLTGRNAIMGTAGYMSPEQCVDTAEVDARSDIYSVGCVLYELVTGRLPYVGSMRELIQQTAGNAPIISPTMLRRDLPPEWERAIMNGLAFRREDRTASALELIRMLAGGTPNGESLMGFFAPRLIADVTIAPTAITISDAVGPAATLWSQANSAILHRATRWRRRALTMFLAGALGGAILTCSAMLVAGSAMRTSGESKQGHIANISSDLDAKHEGRVDAQAHNPPHHFDAGSEALQRLEPIDANDDEGQTTTATSDNNNGAAAPPTDAGILDAPVAAVPLADNQSPTLRNSPPNSRTPNRKTSPMMDRADGAPWAPSPAVPIRAPNAQTSGDAAKVQTGKLLVTVKQTWAQVWIDGVDHEQTPVQATLPVGVHKVLLVGASQRAQVTVTIRAAHVTTVEKDW